MLNDSALCFLRPESLRDSTLLLLFGVVPLGFEVFITAFSSVNPQILITTGPNVLPAPTLIFLIWAPLYYYCPFGIPFLCLIYLFALNGKTSGTRTSLRLLIWLGFISIALAYVSLILQFMRVAAENIMIFLPPAIAVTYIFVVGRFTETTIVLENSHVVTSKTKESVS